MKKIYYSFIFSLILLTGSTSNAQTLAHQSAPPPVNPGYPFLRGMYVDCADDIIFDIANQNALGLEQDLLDYIDHNYIGYIILCGLENSAVFGNTSLETALRTLLNDVRGISQSIQIGIGGSDAVLFQQTPFLNSSYNNHMTCFPSGTINNNSTFIDVLNPPSIVAGNEKNLNLSRFFLNVFAFNHRAELLSNARKCKSGFDIFYLEYRYWIQTSSMAAMQQEFQNFKTALSILQLLKCNSKCIKSVDALFLPTDLYKLQGWTAIDQITEADPLIDRIMLPAYTNAADGVFDNTCKMFHYISDRFSKPASKIFITISAESQSFNYCSSTLTPGNYLGDYLNGTVSPSGNMYSVEKEFISRFNNQNYFCPMCNCYAYSDNHYTPANIWGNILTGAMWLPYSMLKDHQLFRKSKDDDSKIISSENECRMIEIIDMNGRKIHEYSPKDFFESDARKNLIDGIYIERRYLSNGKIENRKFVMAE